MSLLCAIVFSITFVAVTATPTNITGVGANCIITRFDQVESVVNSCTNIVVKDLVVNSGKSLTLNLKPGTTLTFQGTTTFGYYEWEGPLIRISGNKITVVGASGHKLDGQGARWWDGTGDSGKKKPKFMSIQASGGSVFKNINMYNCPRQCVAVFGSNGLTLSNWHIDTSAGDPKNGKNVALNTDGFDFAASNNIVLDGIVVKNQDDCICINDGTNMRFTNLWCYGGHGLSMAAGISKTNYTRNVISNVHFENSHVINSRNGIHIKSVADGGKGKMTGITYSNIQMSGINRYVINVEQNYRNNGGPTGPPNNNVPVDGLFISGISGTMNGPMSMPVYILCATGACNNFKWSNINIKGNAKPNSCNIHPSGFNC